MRRRPEDVLRGLLSERAGLVPVRHDPYATTRRGLRRVRMRRWLTVAVAVCMLGAAAVPVAVFRPFRDVPLEGWPVRGNLIERVGFARDAVRKRAVEWIEAQRRGQDVEYSRVIYAGDNGVRRRVIVVASLVAHERPDGGGRGDGRERQQPSNVFVLLRGSSGASADELVQMGIFSLPGGPAEDGEDQESKPYLARAGKKPGEEGRVFIVGPPETRTMAYSSHPVFHPDGTWSRSWHPLPARNGVALAEVPQLRADVGVARLRFGSETVWVDPNPMRLIGSELVVGDGDIPTVEGLTGPPSGGPPPGVVRAAVWSLRSATGIRADRFEIRATWHGHLWRGAPEEWLLSATLADGTTFQILTTKRLRTWVTLVPRGGSNRPIAVANPPFPVALPAPENYADDTPFRVVVVVPDRAAAHVSLWQGGERLARAPADDAGVAVFEGNVVAQAARNQEKLHFRVVTPDGSERFRGDVVTHRLPPWMRGAQARGER